MLNSLRSLVYKSTFFNPLLRSCKCSWTKMYAGQVVKPLDKRCRTERPVLTKDLCAMRDEQGDPRPGGVFASSALGKRGLCPNICTFLEWILSTVRGGVGERPFCIWSVHLSPLSWVTITKMHLLLPAKGMLILDAAWQDGVVHSAPCFYLIYYWRL